VIARLLIVLLLIPVLAWGQSMVSPSQQNPKNSGVLTSAVNTAVWYVVTGLTYLSNRLQRIDAYCDTGSAQIVVSSAGATIWQSDGGYIGTTSKGLVWIPPLLLPTGNSLSVGLTACGSGNTGTLIVEADQF
jgi:hypothetical protein